MADRLVIEKHYANGTSTIDTCVRCTIFPTTFNETGLESIHIESLDKAILDAYKCYLNYHYGSHGKSLQPKKIIFNGPATIVIWDDGTKTVVKQSEHDIYDHEKGFAMCVVKRVFGDKYSAIRKMVDKAYADTYLDPNSYEVPLTNVLKTIFGRGE